MTRQEEIVKAAHEFYKGDEVSTFIVVAQWADKTMIEKLCEWLEDVDYEMQYQYSEDGYTFFNKDKFIKDFCKAMEE